MGHVILYFKGFVIFWSAKLVSYAISCAAEKFERLVRERHGNTTPSAFAASDAQQNYIGRKTFIKERGQQEKAENNATVLKRVKVQILALVRTRRRDNCQMHKNFLFGTVAQETQQLRILSLLNNDLSQLHSPQ